MKITKLEKLANHITGEVKITVEITISTSDLAEFDYFGLDKFPDESIPDVLVAVGRMYQKRIKPGKIRHPEENRLSTMPDIKSFTGKTIPTTL